ncbi:MAG: heme lyase CcmF/NrfE family subunit, partial [Nitrospinota bacterium]|nr:heme lyase CcmF/NrfE family subunit [Nitrospinota bacterium]
EIGEYSLLVALFLAIYAMVVPILGIYARSEQLVRSSERALLAVFGLHTIASYALMNALYSNDFSLDYVYSYTNSELHPIYTLTAFWAGQKGSLLFWAWMLGLFTTMVLFQNRNRNRSLMPYVVSLISSVMVLFGLLMVVASPVFERMPYLVEDGYGLNPMLQNPGMIFHPPTLYVGFVAFTIPYAFAMAALLSGHMGDIWIRTTRRWTIFAWIFLTFGNLFGANWAYVELGWGGYWAWDPVENASFLPWLTGTAYLHSVMIQEKKDMLKVWNMVLISMTFALTIFGTFITRSGLISSVHSFGESTVGTYFGVFLVIVVAFSIYMIVSNLKLLKSKNELDSMLSREATFLFNNLMLVGAAFAVLWGTMFPMISELFRGQKITVGPPFFNEVMIPIGLGLLLLTGICPLISWRKATWINTRKNFILPLVITAVSTLVFFALGAREALPLVSLTLCAFVSATISTEIIRGAIARSSTAGENFAIALVNLFRRNKRRYGGYLVHIGVVCAFAGFTGAWYNVEVEKTLSPGEEIHIKDYTLTYYKSEASQPKTTLTENHAWLLVEKGGEKLGYVVPERNTHIMKDWRGGAQPQDTSEVAIHSTWKEDLYVIYASANNDGTATFKVHVNPLVAWLWIGGLLMGVGSLFAIWPDAREKKRFLARHSAQTAEASAI